jgi:hypothetical protein
MVRPCRRRALADVQPTDLAALKTELGEELAHFCIINAGGRSSLSARFPDLQLEKSPRPATLV